jgi:hypothetical protein
MTGQAGTAGDNTGDWEAEADEDQEEDEALAGLTPTLPKFRSAR